MGDPAQRRQHRRTLALCRVHHREPDVAEHRAAQAARGGHPLAGAARSRRGARLFRQGPPALRQGQVRARPRAPPARRPRRCAEPGARRLAQRQLLGRPGKPGARRLPRPAHQRRPQGPHGHAALRGGRRRRPARCQPRRRQCAGARQGSHRGDQEGVQRQGAARCGAGGYPSRPGLYLQPRAASAPRRQDNRSRAAHARPFPPTTIRRSTATSGGWSGASSRASFSTAATPRPPTGSHAKRRCPARTIIARKASSPPAGSRCASSTTRPRRSRTFAKIGQANDNPIALARSGYWQGRAAEALGRKDEARAHYETAARYSTAYYGQIARARLGHKDIAVRPPPAPGPAHLEVVRLVEILYALEERDLVAGLGADLGERSNDAAGLAAIAEVMAHNHDARAMLLLGKARGRAWPAARPLRIPHDRPAGIPPHRPGDRARGRLRDRAPGKHVQPAHGVDRQGDGPDAGDAGGREIHRE